MERLLNDIFPNEDQEKRQVLLLANSTNVINQMIECLKNTCVSDKFRSALFFQIIKNSVRYSDKLVFEEIIKQLNIITDIRIKYRNINVLKNVLK